MKIERGRVSYGERAFHQDATEAMRGDIIRALIETITNSDDAYGHDNGKIRIEVEHCRGPWCVITKDRAIGMRAGRMKEVFVVLGGRTSGFETGADVRGNLGRGAKDLAAFGKVTFESICDEKYSKFTLNPTGDYELYPEEKATKEIRHRLGVPRGNGTMVTMEVAKNILCPHHARLVEKLSKHYHLRDIMSDPRRDVTLVSIGKEDFDTLRYAYPSLPIVYSGELEVEGYPDATAIVTIYRNQDRYDDLPSDPYRPNGLLIKGRRAIYENTLFGFESNPFAGWFAGRVECTYIDNLASEYDRRLLRRERKDDKNPIPIITRRRDGLQHNHPFYKALAASVERPLGELVQAEEARARERSAGESTRMRRTLDALGRDLSRLIDDDLREIEEEGLVGDGEAGATVPPVKLVPEQAVLYVGEVKTVTVQARADLGESSAKAELDPEGVVEIAGDLTVPLSPHKKRTDLLVGQLQLRPLLEDNETLLSVRCGDHAAVALVEVRPEREMVEVPAPVPETLQFERESYRVAWMKKKRLQILAPVELVDHEGKEFRVNSSNAGIAVLGKPPGFALDEECEYYIAEVTVEARELGAKATLEAKLGSVRTTCNVAVTRLEEGPNIQIRIVDEEAGKYRALVERESGRIVIKIMGQHPAIKRYRGSAPEFMGDDLSITKGIVAEIVADQAARMVMERKFPLAGGMEQLDAARFYVEHYAYLTKYLARCHRVLVPEPPPDHS